MKELAHVIGETGWNLTSVGWSWKLRKELKLQFGVCNL